MSSVSFVVEQAPEGGYIARAIGAPIVTQVELEAELHEQVREAVRCHFDENQAPKLIHLHFVRDELIQA